MPGVVLEATHGWYWAPDTLSAAGADVYLPHPLGVMAFAYRRVEDVRTLRMGRLSEAWIIPPEVRETAGTDPLPGPACEAGAP